MIIIITVGDVMPMADVSVVFCFCFVATQPNDVYVSFKKKKKGEKQICSKIRGNPKVSQDRSTWWMTKADFRHQKPKLMMAISRSI